MPAEGPPELDDSTAAALLPQRGRRSHKGTHGTLLCLCGSLDYAGAALLAAEGAARAGAGLVAMAVPASLQSLFAARFREAITLGLPEDAASDVDPAGAAGVITARHADALLCGSGWRDSPGNARLLLDLLHQPPGDPDGAAPDANAPMVLDGTALTIVARNADWSRRVGRRCVLTPHPGEFARLTGSAVSDDDADRAARAATAAERFGQVVVLKGARTVIAAADGRLAVAPFENPGLATAGTGDVLAGVIGGLLAQAMEAFEAACLGVYLHGAAGELIRDRIGDAGMIASDLLPEIPVIRHRLARLATRPSRVGFCGPAGAA